MQPGNEPSFPVIYELDENEEVDNVHFFCSVECREVSVHELLGNMRYGECQSAEIVPYTICEACGKPLQPPVVAVDVKFVTGFPTSFKYLNDVVLECIQEHGLKPNFHALVVACYRLAQFAADRDDEDSNREAERWEEDAKLLETIESRLVND